jgi:uncharacterized protein
MTTSQAPTPTIKNPGFKPSVSRRLFVNVPVENVQRSIDFFEALGFTFNAQFTAADATAMLVGEDACVMLATRKRFGDLVTRPIADPKAAVGATFALGLESREAVDVMVKKAVELGAVQAHEPEDEGFMYSAGFYDLDGYAWGPFWTEPAAVEES